jgi:hypothetical protein
MKWGRICGKSADNLGKNDLTRISCQQSMFAETTSIVKTSSGVLFNGFYVMSSLRKGSAQQALACACPVLRRQAVRCMEGTTPVWSQESTKITGFSSGLRGKWPEDELCPTDKRRADT